MIPFARSLKLRLYAGDRALQSSQTGSALVLIQVRYRSNLRHLVSQPRPYGVSFSADRPTAKAGSGISPVAAGRAEIAGAPLDAFERGHPCAGGLSATTKRGDGAATGLLLAQALTFGS